MESCRVFILINYFYYCCECLQSWHACMNAHAMVCGMGAGVRRQLYEIRFLLLLHRFQGSKLANGLAWQTFTHRDISPAPNNYIFNFIYPLEMSATFT